MKTFEINGTVRSTVGKKETKALRAEGKVPCVLYGRNSEPIHFCVPERDFKDIIYTPSVYIINLNVEGKVYKSMLQDTQFHPVNDSLMHADFLEVYDDTPIKISVPIKVEGYAKGMRAGGRLKVELRKLKVKALPKNLPDNVLININNLELGESYKVGELSLDNVEFLNPASNPVVSIAITRAAKAAASEAKKDGGSDNKSEDK
ncbi:MAG: 50S ribosomal protein L25/general stress protein Ctc [Bacteroidales bacterium]